jgi:hypothetical protein
MTKGSFKLPLFSNMLIRTLSRGLFLTLLAIFLTKFFHTSGRIDNFLLASIERMADRADFDMQWPSHSGSGLEGTAATTGDGDFLVVWVNIRFHGVDPRSVLATAEAVG